MNEGKTQLPLADTSSVNQQGNALIFVLIPQTLLPISLGVPSLIILRHRPHYLIDALLPTVHDKLGLSFGNRGPEFGLLGRGRR